MKNILPVAFLFFGLCSAAQDYHKNIKGINTIDLANAFMESNPTLSAEIIEINSGIDTSATAKKIAAAKPGKPLTMNGYTYKIIESKRSFLVRVSYIYLDNSKLTLAQIDSLRTGIVSKYKSGVPFTDLAKEYNMDGNPNCDLGWNPREMLDKDFSTAIMEHKTGDIFSVNIPDKKWYYVALKTFNEREVNVYSVLRIKNNS